MMLTTPKVIDNTIKDLLRFLKIKQSSSIRLKLSKLKNFNPEPKNCHLNTYIQSQIEGGAIQYGWVIWQDNLTGSTEAEFHSIWKNQKGELLDITPRVDGEKKILFVPDFTREVYFTEKQGKLIINTYDNVRLFYGHLLNEVIPIQRILTSALIDEFRLLSHFR
ncbi:hypothetical protein [Chroococcus sp. FPU101]|uniref:hypothetical protein n=1 Tax=Chroococcus sp. FPU101 TaxID=1974212 RepID=UPI001A9075CC|nr:hypothetical protein [Chroococcus sp. FPU101]